MIRLIFDNLKPISKQKGYELGYRWIRGRRVMTKYMSQDYQSFKTAVGLLAKAEARKQHWIPQNSQDLGVQGYFFCPKKVRAQDVADNAFSGFLDAFQGILYANDAQIIRAYYERIRTKAMMRVELVFYRMPF